MLYVKSRASLTARQPPEVIDLALLFGSGHATVCAACSDSLCKYFLDVLAEIQSKTQQRADGRNEKV